MRRSNGGDTHHRVGLATPPVLLGPVSPQGVLAFAIDPTGLPGGEPRDVVKPPLTAVTDPSPTTPFGVAVRAGGDVAVFRDGPGTIGGVGLSPTRHRDRPLVGAALLGASRPPPAAADASWFPDEPAFRGTELFHAAAALLVGAGLMEMVLAGAGSAGKTIRPGMAGAGGVHLEGAVPAEVEVSLVGRHYTAPDGAAGGPSGAAGNHALRISGSIAFGREERVGNFTLDGEVRAQAVQEPRLGSAAEPPQRLGSTLAWTDRGGALEWERRASRPGGGEGEVTAAISFAEKSPGKRRVRLFAGFSRSARDRMIQSSGELKTTAELQSPPRTPEAAAVKGEGEPGGDSLPFVNGLDLALSPEIRLRPWGDHGNDLAFFLGGETELEVPLGTAGTSQEDGALLGRVSVGAGMEREDIALRVEIESLGEPVVASPESFRDHYRVTAKVRLSGITVPEPVAQSRSKW